ncbi:ATP-dependent DNA ligase [Methanococcus voltae]|uniref:DNA ligase n=1 Tax=Methanococcus voltae (strain ATCC BAA-1334 / A3) TaxID=456320 RepID=D7DRU5_METV3|nr:ATP-dependent DNA ligase [Methanococcus voltae]MCS3901173.1 DNA ligase-1 [Methanococcus voltae]
MLFKDYCEIIEKIEKTTKRLEKTDYFVELIKKLDSEKKNLEKSKNVDNPAEILNILCKISIGRVFAEYENKELGIGYNLLVEAFKSVGISEKDIYAKVKETGDLGQSVELLKSEVKQITLFQTKLTIKEVYSSLKKLSSIEGTSSQKKKIRTISNLLISANALETRYLARLILEDMRIGMNISTILGAFSIYFGIPKPELEKTYAVSNDIGKIGERLLSYDGNYYENFKKDSELHLKLFRPIKPMLAQLTPSISDAIIEMGIPQFETKYDGARVQIHKNGDNVKIYSRRLEDITNSIPEIVEEVKKIDCNQFIVEGECVAIDENGKPRPFQDILRRFRRKYDIEKMTSEIKLRVFLFDVIYKDGESISDSLQVRRQKLESMLNIENNFNIDENGEIIVSPINDVINLSTKLITNDVKKAQKFFDWCLSIGHEGVMIKNQDATYTAGSRVKTMYKFKPTLDNLDVVITRAKFGMGKRKDWYGSYEIAVRGNGESEDNNLYVIGHVGSGLTEENLEELTKKINEIKEADLGDEVIVEPKIVFEVSYEEIQASEKYEIGYALRFPRVINIRYDKNIDDINTVEDVKRIYEIQKNRKNKND